MDRLEQSKHQQSQRKLRIRNKINGTSERPRLSVFISNKHITAQVIDDQAKKTLVYVSTIGKKPTGKLTMTEQAKNIGSELAKKAKAVKIVKVVFDRNGRLYHGRVKALADASRENGLEF